MNRGIVIDLLDRLHAENEFYAGAARVDLHQILAPEITWTVPGENQIAGTYRGVDHRWSTVGLYDIVETQITACWLLPLDQRTFDAIWSDTDPIVTKDARVHRAS